MGEDKVFFKKVENSSTLGGVWIVGWLFTLGFLKLSFFKGILAIFVWPYYLGDYFSAMIK